MSVPQNAIFYNSDVFTILSDQIFLFNDCIIFLRFQKQFAVQLFLDNFVLRFLAKLVNFECIPP